MSKRLYGLDLLKIIAMIFIIGLHFNFRTGALANFPFTDGRFYPTGISEAIFYVSVDCFVLVTGYFDIVKKQVNVKRLVHLVLAVWFYSWVGLLVGLMAGARPSLNQLLMCALPFTTEHFWFIDVYLILSLLTPFINKAIADIDQKGYKGILLVSFIGFSVLPSLMPFASEIFSINGGANIVWFVILYLIGGYLRLYNPFERVSSKKLVLGFTGLSLITFTVKLASQMLVAFLFSGKHIGGGVAVSPQFHYRYCRGSVAFCCDATTQQKRQ
ncbi:acyltransferase family protein [Collinsella aerofaciens]|uniref:acyltransferase family protein n=1 Tax=Collinsella aerofaciens TaxID=74426 RepID=UPI0012ABBD3E|nr:acyltransferase [Collinsella aerofaciens]